MVGSKIARQSHGQMDIYNVGSKITLQVKSNIFYILPLSMITFVHCILFLSVASSIMEISLLLIQNFI